MIIAFLGFLLILYKTLYPFDFLFSETYNKLGYRSLLLGWGETNTLDVQGNLLLFIPLGFGLTGYLMQTMRLPKRYSFSVIIIISFLLSYTIEVLQVFQPSRFPSMGDVFSNSVGGLLGFLLFRLWERRVKVFDNLLLFVGKNLWLCFFGYALFALLVSISFQWYSGLSNWNKTFPLILGNERTGDRPWEGCIFELHIADKALSESEMASVFSEKNSFALIKDYLLASYQLSALGNYRDKKGVLPDLVWTGKTHDVQQSEGVFLSHNNWLETVVSAESLTQRIVETSQFTLGISLATRNTSQTGPARIISLSEDTGCRNFTLAQLKTDLIFRLRTPLTGRNGTHPELIVPEVFSSTNLHNLVITYNGSVLHLYIDGVLNPNKLELTPGGISLRYLFHPDRYHLVCYKIIYYLIIFAPLSMLYSITVKSISGRYVIKKFIICGAIILSSFIVEAILMSLRGRGLRLENLMIGIIILAGPMVLKLLLPKKITENERKIN
ncbi:MAG: hypothetical protein E3K37_14020 [Candidatus Kuenenia sp.]|nr:hypothetical protein [Candidatus Kuenenia hertensis]